MNWEHKTVKHDLTAPVIKDIDDRLSKIGEEGWELVTVVCIGDFALVYYFKRPKNEPFDTAPERFGLPLREGEGIIP